VRDPEASPLDRVALLRVCLIRSLGGVGTAPLRPCQGRGLRGKRKEGTDEESNSSNRVGWGFHPRATDGRRLRENEQTVLTGGLRGDLPHHFPVGYTDLPNPWGAKFLPPGNVQRDSQQLQSVCMVWLEVREWPQLPVRRRGIAREETT
jgi:hypothetical protein